MTDRISQVLAILGATHHAESVISLLNGAALSLRSRGRDGFHDVLGDAETQAWVLVTAIQKMRDENWNARCQEYDAARNVVVPIRQNERA